MAKDMVLEIGVEEIPSAYMPDAIRDLKNIAEDRFSSYRLKYQSLHSYGTPRRLALLVDDLGDWQENSIIENKGPKASIAIDADGNPTKAGLGFARSQGMEFKDLEIRAVNGTQHLFAIKKVEGQPVERVLGQLLTEIVGALSFPKSMRWGYYQTRFARPIRWLLALLGDQVVDFSVENINSSRITFGHRFLSQGALEVKDVQHYRKVLSDNYVILDQNERAQMISQQIKEAAQTVDGVPMQNDELLEEVNYLVEYPTAFCGEFSEEYLQVPTEVLTTTMIEHQRYFPVFDAQGQLMPSFIGIRNGTDYNLDEVKKGNQRVLKARLEDALFFWKEDTKKPLEEMAPLLANVLFHERLGTVEEKAERIRDLGVFIGKASHLSNARKLTRAAYLCKADLVSHMVYEFPELQGVMGRYYALQSGEDTETSEAIFEHYLPRFSGDRLPLTETGRALSLADKFDNLVGCFSIGIKPTGSQDPYALRRQALGIVNIILDARLDLDIRKVAEKAYAGLAKVKPDYSSEDTANQVVEFIIQRMKGLLLDRGIPYDVIDAVLAAPSNDLNNIMNRVRAVEELKKSDYFEDFMVVYNRSNNLSRNWEKDQVDIAKLIDNSERALYAAYCEVKEKVDKNLNQSDFTQAIHLLAGLRPHIDQFFSSVMVLVDDDELKAARLGLLKSVANTCHMIAEFGLLVA
jgi:glycyl-tRNA synthetase beta chain